MKWAADSSAKRKLSGTTTVGADSSDPTAQPEKTAKATTVAMTVPPAFDSPPVFCSLMHFMKSETDFMKAGAARHGV
jgi:hypothetical protein